VPARRLVALYSAPKVGKSLLCLELAVAVSQGERILGWQPERPRRVLYVDFENDPRGDIRARLQAMGHEPDDLANLCYLSFPTLAGLDSEQGAAELVAASQVYDCEVIVIDTVSRSVDGDENENDTWLAFYRHTGLKLKQLGVSMIRLDHAGKDETKGQRGGSAKEGDVDAVWRMQRLTDGADGGDEAFRLTCTHNRFQLSPGDKVLDIIRHAAPLHHTIRAAGARDLIVDAIVAYLDSIDAPVADGYRKYSVDELKRSGIPGASQRTLSDAIDRRRRRASWDDDNDGDDA
jgi:RecA-family ATPase